MTNPKSTSTKHVAKGVPGLRPPAKAQPTRSPMPSSPTGVDEGNDEAAPPPQPPIISVEENDVDSANGGDESQAAGAEEVDETDEEDDDSHCLAEAVTLAYIERPSIGNGRDDTAAGSRRKCSGTTTDGEPCEISRHLDEERRYKHHSLINVTCGQSGGTNKGGKYSDLDRNGRRDHHKKRQGIAKNTGQQRRIQSELDGNGFREFHKPQDESTMSATCRDIAKSTGERCKIAWDLGSDGYCKYHKRQDQSMMSATCRGIAKNTGERCRIKWDLDSNGYCKKYHWWQFKG